MRLSKQYAFLTWILFDPKFSVVILEILSRIMTWSKIWWNYGVVSSSFLLWLHSPFWNSVKTLYKLSFYEFLLTKCRKAHSWVLIRFFATKTGISRNWNKTWLNSGINCNKTWLIEVSFHWNLLENVAKYTFVGCGSIDQSMWRGVFNEFHRLLTNKLSI